MKNRYLFIILGIAVCSFAFMSSCGLVDCVKGSGHPDSVKRKVADFTKIDIKGSYRILLKQDSSLSITVSGDDNLLKYIETNVSDDKLFIKSNKDMCPNNQMTLTIGVHNIKEITSLGALELYSKGTLNLQDLKLDFSGNTRTILGINAANVTTKASGNAEITLKGQAMTHTVNFSGSEKFDAFGFVVSDYDIESSGNTECDINVLHSLDLHTSGSSVVKYKGAPVRLVNEKSGLSTLERVN
jgi:hypothetical protein